VQVSSGLHRVKNEQVRVITLLLKTSHNASGGERAADDPVGQDTELAPYPSAPASSCKACKLSWFKSHANFSRALCCNCTQAWAILLSYCHGQMV
jgi:hypothetical protein